MEERLSEVLTRSANYIPPRCQLPRTPPMTSVKRHLNFGSADESVLPNSNEEADKEALVLGSRSCKIENPYSMLKGMKGYCPTPDDLNFLKKKTEDELVKKLQGELAETQALLKKEVNVLELALASREMMLASLNKFPSCDKLSNWAKLVIGKASPLNLTDLDTKSLLAMVTIDKIQRFIDQKKAAMAQMEATAAEKYKKEAEDRGQLKIQVANEELKIQELIRQLTDLKSELFQQEMNTGKEPREDSEKLQATKGNRRHQQNQKKDVKLRETHEIECKSRQKHTNKEMSVKHGRAVTEMSKQKSGAVMGEPPKQEKVTRGRRQKIEPLETQQAVPELRRSKRIANRN
ncbi:hypothetical protein ILYODFUR_024676 [Ilyodon furcidens]|uniref:Uncharacterized protein n=1 Tax=Ilyodon furcidens TaxID=33524 RepID=A0ABV0VGT6_9TELE